MALRFFISEAWAAWHHHSGWMAWNLFLAFIPLVLSVWLFRQPWRFSSFLWWVAFLIFLAFLPNAPYLLTDIIHLIKAIRSSYSIWIITLVLIPQHLGVILLGFEAYVLCLINMGYYLRQQEIRKFIPFAELTMHALCAIGIYLGRFKRYNSWDFVTQTEDIIDTIFDDLTTKQPLLVMAVTFVVLTVLYWLMKQVTLGVILKFKYKRRRQQSSPDNL